MFNYKIKVMPFYHKLGKIPHKRHIQFRKEDGSLYYEQLFGTVGFDGMSSNIYHEHRPTQVKEIRKQYSVAPKIAKENNIQSYRLRGFEVAPENDFLDSRKIVLTNSDCHIALAAPKASMKDYFYKNTDSDEIIFIHKGTGKLRTFLGNLDFKYGDYLVIPRGMIYQIDFNTPDNRLFIVESKSPIYTPKRYRNWFGQLLEHSPFCERDIRQPQELETYDEKGDFVIKVKKKDEIFEMVYATHPFDVVGYDGFNYPYALSIHDFEPITGRIHQPPPVHQTFETSAFVICRSEEHTSELQSRPHLVCRLLLEKKKCDRTRGVDDRFAVGTQEGGRRGGGRGGRGDECAVWQQGGGGEGGGGAVEVRR